MIVIPFIILVFVAVSFIIMNEIKMDKQHEENIQRCLNQLYYIEPFSVAEYYERIEKANLKILQEKEKQEDYRIILWIGLDGIRLNDDGTTEWIKRNEKEKVPVESIVSPLQNCKSFTYNSQCQNVSQTQNFASLQSQINCLQTQNDLYYWKQLQYQQCQNIINTIQPPYISSYQTRLMFPTYLITQCCCDYSSPTVKW